MSTTEESGITLRTDNIEGHRTIPATDWWLWGLAAVFLFFGRGGDLAGIAMYAVGGLSLTLAFAFTFFFKKVQVLKAGRWETLKSLASPSQAKEIVDRLHRA